MFALKTPHKESKPLRLQSSWTRLKCRCLEAYWMKQCAHVLGEHFEILENFTQYFDNIMQNNSRSHQEDLRLTGLADSVLN